MINRIARSLAMEPRWAGNLRSEYFVSDHIIIGDQWLQRAGVSKQIRKAWFIHDASEAYIRDMPTPEKRNMPDYQKRETYLMREIGSHFAVSEIDLIAREIKLCDNAMAAAEDATVHFEPCGSYGEADSALVGLIDQRERLDWHGRVAVFLGLHRELWAA